MNAPKLLLTRAIAYSAGLDAANRSMRTAGRKAWSEEDAGVAAAEFTRLWPLCKHGADRECCFLCLDSRSHYNSNGASGKNALSG